MDEKQKKVSAFDILKEMSRRNLDIRGFPLMPNLKSANIGKINGIITMMVDPQTVKDILTEKPLIGMLLIADRKQYENIEAELTLAEVEALTADVSGV